MTEQEKFWTFVRERETIRLRRERGEAPPWTKDDRLMNYWFPNIRREDDPATQWFRRSVQLEDPEQQLLATVLFRMTGGWVPTFRRLVPMFEGCGYREADLLAQIGPLKTPFSPHVHAPLRADNVAGLAAAVAAIQSSGGLWPLVKGASLREAHRAFCGVPGIGPEMAYEIALDFRRRAYDAMTWAYPGQSSVAAAARLLDRELGPLRRQDCADAVGLMKTLLEEGKEEFPTWRLAEIQRGLTLFHFWAREPRPTRRFRW